MRTTPRQNPKKLLLPALIVSGFFIVFVGIAGVTNKGVFAASATAPDPTTSQNTAPAKGDVCGEDIGKDDDAKQTRAVHTSINLGCKGKGNPIMDMLFAILRFLSNGVGLIIIGSLIYAGIQYSMSRGDPQAVALALKRIQSTILALLLFIFAYAIINYIVPGLVL